MQSHEHYMQRALELAARGTGCTSPNPLVGCVVVRDGVTLGEGWHAVYGQGHAEINALNASLANVSHPSWRADAATPLTVGATLYVTLEPCNHHGLTPPCTQAIVDAGIAHVIYAMADPNPRAAGGARWLRAQGVKVTDGVLEKEARFQNRFFLRHVLTRQPYVIAKTATSLDGRIATRTGHSQWITGVDARQKSHELRQAVDAIIVGADTVIADDPSLTVRLPDSVLSAEAVRHPRPVILDSTGRIPLDRKLLDASLPTRSLVATTDLMNPRHRQTLESRGIEVVSLPLNTRGPGVEPAALLDALGHRGIQSVLLEGGASVQGVFRDAGLIDELWCFIAPTVIGGALARTAYAGLGSDSLDEATRLDDIHIETIGDDLLVRGSVIHPGRVTSSSAPVVHETPGD